jgi:HAD superfamily hydrolase (TIGR01490 family)
VSVDAKGKHRLAWGRQRNGEPCPNRRYNGISDHVSFYLSRRYPIVTADALAVFDLDHTLVPHDSDEEWVAFLVEEGALDRAQWDAANRDLIARFNRGEAGTIEFTEFYLSTLTRFDDDTLARLRERYLDVRVRPRIAAEARTLVDSHRAAGDLVIVTTAVIRFLSESVAAEFGIRDVIATEAERLDGRYTGRVAGLPNAREGKFERLLMFLAARGQKLTDFRAVYAYCDSLNDLPLLSQVSNPVAVNADPVLSAHARHMGWPVMQIG